MKQLIMTIAIIVLALPVLAQHCGSCPNQGKHGINKTEENSRKVIDKPKTTYRLENDYTINYQWSKKPKIGTQVLLVSVYDQNKKPVTDLTATANAYMPSMKGSHDTGDKKMQVNKKNQYAIPVNFMMLGEWEIELKFHKGTELVSNPVVKLVIK